MKLFYWTMHFRLVQQDGSVLEGDKKIPVTFMILLFLWIGNAKILAFINKEKEVFLSIYYISQLHKRTFNVVAQSSTNDPQQDIVKLCKAVMNPKRKNNDEIRRNRKQDNS